MQMAYLSTCVLTNKNIYNEDGGEYLKHSEQ